MRVAGRSFGSSFLKQHAHDGSAFFCKVQNRHSLLSTYSWKMVQEGIERLASFQIVQQSLHRYPCPYEDRSAPENTGI